MKRIRELCQCWVSSFRCNRLDYFSLQWSVTQNFNIRLNMNLFKLISTDQNAEYQTISLSGTLRLTFVPFYTDISQRLLNKLTWGSPIDNLLPLLAPCKLGVPTQWGSVTLCHSMAPNCLAAVSVKTPEVASQMCWQQSSLWTVVSRDCFLVKHKARLKMTASSCSHPVSYVYNITVFMKISLEWGKLH